jgi:NADPH:quinone reductase-like Zn-dependent oxidoreductase
MKAIRIHQYGGPEVLRYEEAPRPEPGDGEALVRVHAAGVNPIDWKARAGYLSHIAYRLPLIPGWDFSGTVESLGPGAGDVTPGQEMHGRADITRNGTYAEYVVVRAKDLVRKPRSIDHLHAAAVPIAGLTAWQALVEPGAMGLQKGQTVLILGAAGSVGTLAVQIARWRGARVIATGSTRNGAFLRELGADVFVDYTRDRLEESVRDVDGVLDTIGGETQASALQVLKRGGVLVSIVGAPPAEATRASGVKGVGLVAQNRTEDLEELARLIDAGQLRPIVTEILPLAQARRAHELSQAGHVRGKIVLQIVPPL